MKHDCKLKLTEVYESDDGHLYVKAYTGVLKLDTIVYPVEYCPVCGIKGKKSHIEHLTFYKRSEIAESQLEHMHNKIMEIFLSSCETLVKEDLDDKSFKFCIDTIHNTLAYVGSKRKE